MRGGGGMLGARARPDRTLKRGAPRLEKKGGKPRRCALSLRSGCGEILHTWVTALADVAVRGCESWSKAGRRQRRKVREADITGGCHVAILSPLHGRLSRRGNLAPPIAVAPVDAAYPASSRALRGKARLFVPVSPASHLRGWSTRETRNARLRSTRHSAQQARLAASPLLCCAAARGVAAPFCLCSCRSLDLYTAAAAAWKTRALRATCKDHGHERQQKTKMRWQVLLCVEPSAGKFKRGHCRTPRHPHTGKCSTDAPQTPQKGGGQKEDTTARLVLGNCT